jgi:hypothetical protein
MFSKLAIAEDVFLKHYITLKWNLKYTSTGKNERVKIEMNEIFNPIKYNKFWSSFCKQHFSKDKLSIFTTREFYLKIYKLSINFPKTFSVIESNRINNVLACLIFKLFHNDLFLWNQQHIMVSGQDLDLEPETKQKQDDKWISFI